MQFLNPLALAGLAAALIPLAVHLLHRGRPREVPFSHLVFLRELHQSRMRSVRLRQWLVLLLRMLALACLALAFARPALQTGGGLLAGARPTTAVLLLDHSYSTRHAPPAGRVFDRLRRRADEVLALLDGDDDRVYLLPFGDAPGPVEGPLTVAAARRRLAERVPGEGGTDVAAALGEARRLLAGLEDRQREIYLITDGAAAGWRAVQPADEPGAVPVYLLLEPSGPAANLFTGPVHLERWLATVGRPLDLEARVGLAGDGPVEAAVDLFLDGERVQRTRVALTPGAQTAAGFTPAPRRSGRLTGHVEVEADALPLDNRRWFTVHVPERLSVTLAGAGPEATYYPRRALAAAAVGDETLEVTTLGFDQLSGPALAATDVLILCHVERPGAAQVRAVHDFVAGGGHVLILPGPDADLGRLNRDLLPALVPASLGEVVGTPGGTATVGLDTAGVDADLFAGLLVEPTDRPRFHATFAVAAGGRLAVRARFDDGRPALVEGSGRDGAGRALLWATPLDLAWTDLPLRGLFVPLLHRLCRYLAQPEAHAAAYTVGERAWRRLPGVGLEARVEAETPDGRRRVLQSETVLGETLWKVAELDEAGIWRLRADGEPVDAFAVNVALAEADLTRLDPVEAKGRLGAGALVLDGSRPPSEALLDARFGRELWRELLLLAGLLLLLELWLARAPAAPRLTTAAGSP